MTEHCHLQAASFSVIFITYSDLSGFIKLFGEWYRPNLSVLVKPKNGCVHSWGEPPKWCEAAGCYCNCSKKERFAQLRSFDWERCLNLAGPTAQKSEGWEWTLWGGLRGHVLPAVRVQGKRGKESAVAAQFVKKGQFLNIFTFW